MSSKSITSIVAVLLAFFGTASKAAESPELSLIWNDAYQILPISYEGIAEEVAEIFEEIAVRVSWTKAGQDPAVEPHTVQVRVVLMPNLSSKWSLPHHTMGVVIGDKVPRETVFISYSGVVSTMGYEPTADRARSPRERAALTRALGRVIAHELAHAIVPERDHDTEGLLSANLKRSHLTESKLRFVDETAAAFVETLAALQNRVAAASEVATPPGS